MPYTTNPNLPKIRAQAVIMVKNGKSIRQVARYYGFNPSTIHKWIKRSPPGRCTSIPTQSSRPKNHPKKLKQEIVQRIIDLRIKTNGRCAEVIHQLLINEGIKVCLKSVKRTLDRNCLTKKRSPWKRYHAPTLRPLVSKPGDLIQLDTIHLMKNEKERIYIYTLLDVYSRWAYAWASERMNAMKTVKFVRKAKQLFPWDFNHLQSDHGPEFGTHFTERIKISHRHSRVRRPNDNAHLERFNRTLQNELIDHLPKDVKTINEHLTKYLNYYNQERLHLGLDLKTPCQILTKCCQAIG